MAKRILLARKLPVREKQITWPAAIKLTKKFAKDMEQKAITDIKKNLGRRDI